MAEDKLPAIGAVAKLIQSHFDDKYLAGFFTTQLPQGFLWFRIRRQVSPSNEIQNNTRARRYTEGSYRAPTWSWACVDGPISFHFCYPDITIHSVVAPKAHDIVGSGQFATIIDWKVELVDPQNPFGQLKNAYVLLRGPLVEVDEAGEYSPGVPYLKARGLLSSGNPILRLDVAFEPSGMLRVFFLPILWRRSVDRFGGTDGRDVEYGLVLVPSSNLVSETYERIGIFEGDIGMVNVHLYQGSQDVKIV
jgi:hypothetical protein